MSGHKATRVGVAGVMTALLTVAGAQTAEARGPGCWTSIGCAIAKAIAGWGAKRLLEGADNQPSAPQPQAPIYESRPAPPVPVLVCHVMHECRVVRTGNCHRISPLHVRCLNERQCRTRRNCL